MDHNDKAIPDVDAIEATCFPGPLRFEVDTKNSHGEPQVLNSCIDDEGVSFLFVGNEDSDRPTEAEARATPEYVAGQRIVKLVNAAPALCAHVRRLTADNARLLGLLRRARTAIDPACEADADLLVELDAELERKPCDPRLPATANQGRMRR